MKCRESLAPFAFVLLLGGCATKEFSSSPLYTGGEVKFVGAVEDRVNLWPLAYWREPVGSLAWPLVSWGDDHLALRPLGSWYRRRGGDEFNVLWPIGQFDATRKANRVFPLFWGRDRGDKPYCCLFPVLWRNAEFSGVFPFFWESDLSASDGGFCVFPLCWAGWQKDDHLRHALWPLYRWDDGDFHSLPYARYRRGDTWQTRILCGLAGANASINGECEASWLFPLYYRDRRRLVTPLFGKAGDSLWLFPLFYRDEDTFVTPLYGRHADADWLFPIYAYKKGDYFISIPYGRERSGQTFFCGLAGLRDGNKSGGWLFPLFSRSSSRTVAFDAASRARVSEREKGETTVLLLLYNYGHAADTATGERRVSHRVLWRLWNWEETNGDVSLDVFPGFTYDAKTNGYAKASLLWRLFRYERDPLRGTAVDFLFVPVWR